MDFLLSVFWIIVIYVVIAVIWIAAEKVIYGQITTRHIDTVVALILAMSIYPNIKK